MTNVNSNTIKTSNNQIPIKDAIKSSTTFPPKRPIKHNFWQIINKITIYYKHLIRFNLSDHILRTSYCLILCHKKKADKFPSVFLIKNSSFVTVWTSQPLEVKESKRNQFHLNFSKANVFSGHASRKISSFIHRNSNFTSFPAFVLIYYSATVYLWFYFCRTFCFFYYLLVFLLPMPGGERKCVKKLHHYCANLPLQWTLNTGIWCKSVSSWGMLEPCKPWRMKISGVDSGEVHSGIFERIFMNILLILWRFLLEICLEFLIIYIFDIDDEFSILIDRIEK